MMCDSCKRDLGWHTGSPLKLSSLGVSSSGFKQMLPGSVTTELPMRLDQSWTGGIHRPCRYLDCKPLALAKISEFQWIDVGYSDRKRVFFFWSVSITPIQIIQDLLRASLPKHNICGILPKWCISHPESKKKNWKKHDMVAQHLSSSLMVRVLPSLHHYPYGYFCYQFRSPGGIPISFPVCMSCFLIYCWWTIISMVIIWQTNMTMNFHHF